MHLHELKESYTPIRYVVHCLLMLCFIVHGCSLLCECVNICVGVYIWEHTVEETSGGIEEVLGT